MQVIDPTLITTDTLPVSFANGKEIRIDVLRLDRIHPVVSGNKWFKLRYHLDSAIEQRKQTILTFGGPWSNHIVATATLCKMKGLNSIGIIRGEEPSILSPTLLQAKAMGMSCYFITRETYRDKNIPGDLTRGDYYQIPEGGYDKTGMKGAATIADQFTMTDYTHVCCAAGTGTMAAGLLNAGGTATQIVAISVLKGHTHLRDDILHLAGNHNGQLQVIHDYHFGGYARYKPELVQFMNELFQETNIPTDFVYTAKTFFAVMTLASQDYFPRNSRVLIIHSGGLQGNASFEKGTLIF